MIEIGDELASRHRHAVVVRPGLFAEILDPVHKPQSMIEVRTNHGLSVVGAGVANDDVFPV